MRKSRMKFVISWNSKHTLSWSVELKSVSIPFEEALRSDSFNILIKELKNQQRSEPRMNEDLIEFCKKSLLSDLKSANSYQTIAMTKKSLNWSNNMPNAIFWVRTKLTSFMNINVSPTRLSFFYLKFEFW